MVMSQYIADVHNLILYKMEAGDLNLESKEALKSVLEEYEVHIRLIEQQLEVCKKDHIELQSEIAKLIEENRALTQQIKMASENAIYKEEQATQLLSEQSNNLKKQLDLALEEKNAVEALWKSSLKELEIMKEKLEDYKSGKQLIKVHRKLSDVQIDYSEAIQILESKISVLKTENNQLTAKNDIMKKELSDMTKQVAKVSEQSLSVSNLMKEVSTQEREWKSRYLLLEAKYIELDKAYQADKVKFANVYKYENIESHLEGKLELAIQQRDELQAALETCHEKMSEIMITAANDRNKVEEAVKLVEEAMQKQGETFIREANSREEIRKLKTELEKIVGKAGQKVSEDVETVQNQFQQLITALREELQLVKQEKDRKIHEVQQWQKECERLQDLKEQMKGSANRLQEDRVHLSTVYKELQFTEAECHKFCLENEQLVLENNHLHKSLTELQERCRKSSRTKVRLKQELKRVQKQCQACQHELSVTIERADLVSQQLNQTNLQLTRLQSLAILQRDNIDNAQARISSANMMDLYKCLDNSYCQMNDKWKNEMKTLTEKFEAKLKKLKTRSKHDSIMKKS